MPHNGALLAEAQIALASGAHPERARRDAETLLLHVFARRDAAKNRAWLLTHLDSEVAPDATAEFHALVERRLAGEPIQYIVGEAQFYGLPFYVTRDVLIPRPETEHVVEKALQLAAGFRAPRIVDVGTGSGAMAVALAAHLGDASISAIDVSAAALAVARRNAERNGVADRIRFRAGDLLDPVAGEPFEIVVSNPPYVAEAERDTLAAEVREFEPAAALFAGADGLAIYRRLIPGVFAALAAGGFLVLEVGHGQRDAVSALLEAAGFRAIEFTADLQGIPRVAVGQRP
ncbi:MAG TPA: peptide chain release factor N(5)-glutamine methyltransferase [Terracidiphilus sp.]|nr:peptide chain release factor N(5)-glutamine methyltransferase [Terracidiphilus sp.]